MSERFLNDAKTNRERRGRGNRPLGAHIESAAESLVEAGYAAASVQAYRRAARTFEGWLSQNELAAVDVDEHLIDAFLDERRSQGSLRRGQGSSIHHLLCHLRMRGVVPQPVPPGDGSPVDRLVTRYERHLRVERGLTEATVVGYRPSILGFLKEKFGDGPLRLRDLKSADVTTFLLRQAHSLSHGRAKLMTTALRSLFRFLLQYGEIEVDLAAAVLAVARRDRSILVKYLQADEVERLLGACDRGARTGQRDYAILLLLARLGLRASELIALELDDIDWRSGELTVAGKGLRKERLPLPADVGAALAVYIRDVRPQVETRRVFLRLKAPLRGFHHPSTVTTIVCRALARADLHPPRRGAHLLRHSLATGLLRHGASMAEIGQVLRHRSAATTEVYAKVDFDGLRALAQPWPGVGGAR